MEKTFDLAMLAHFTGSETIFRHGLVRSIQFTEGAKYVADTAGAYWLLDEIALANKFSKVLTGEAFQVWKLRVARDLGHLTCGDGNGNTLLSKRIAFTDFPEPGIEMWLSSGVIMLPSEY